MQKMLFVIFFFLVSFYNFVEAKPTGFNLKSGDAQIAFQDDRSFVIQSNQNSVINWDSFSIDLNDHVQFQQMNEKNYVLNQITGSDVSALHGTLTSNGAVYLINPNGILIGPNAYIETVGFIASTLDLLDEDLSKGVFSLNGVSENDVINQGKIHCPLGDIFLIGKTVENSGKISAPQGRVGLLSGNDIVICPDKAPKVQIHTTEQIDDEMLEENPYALAICHDGHAHGKKIYLASEKGLCEVNGEIIATGKTGGDVQIEGDYIHLIDETLIDVSGENGGGNVFIGGGCRGQDPLIRNAKQVWVGEDVLVKADALIKGDGGKVVFWSNEATFHYGKISIKGGKVYGDGGLAEVSGPLLEYHGMTYGSALNGKSGTLLLDPVDINIGGSATTGSWGPCAPPITYAPVTGTATNQILNTDLQTQLGSCSVTIDTTEYGGSGPNNGSITVASAVTWATANTLTLEANSYISVSAALTSSSSTTGFTAISLTSYGDSSGANPGILITAQVASGTGGSGGGDIIIDGTSDTAATSSHGVRVSTGGSVDTEAGDISITGTAPVGPTNQCFGIYISVNSFCSSSSGDITIIGNSKADGNGSNGFYLEGYTWAAGTSGDISVGTGSNPCQGGYNANCQGVNLQPSSFSTSGDLSLYGIGGRGDASNGNSHGIILGGTNSIGGNFYAWGQTVGSSDGDGIWIRTGTTSTTTGTITMVGYNGVLGGGHRNAISFSGGKISTTSGDISLTGTTGAVPDVRTHGVNVGTTDAITSTSGDITITGDASSALSASSAGVYFPNSCAMGTTGTVTFINCKGGQNSDCHGVFLPTAFSSGGAVTFTNCEAAADGGYGHGVYVTNTFSAAGTISGTGIQGKGSGGIGFYFSSAGNYFRSTGGNISLTATASGTSGACHGISVAAGDLETTGGSGSITLSGTGSGNTTTASDGIIISSTGTVQTSGSGAISLTGIASGASSSAGIRFSKANPVTSSSGSITLDGTSTATLAGAHGVSFTSSWNTGTSSTLSITGSGGGTGASHGINIGAALTNTGATTLNGTAGGGTGGYGTSFGAGVTTSGGTITVTGSSLLSASIVFDTTNSGGTPAGASILFSGAGATIDGAAAGSQTFNPTAGTGGSVTFGGAVGSTTRLGAITVDSANALSIGNNITAASFTVSNSIATTLTSTSIINTTGDISFTGTINAAAAGSQSLTLAGGSSGTITLSSAVGGSTRLNAFSVTTGSSFVLSNDVTANSFNVSYPVATTLTVAGTTTITTSDTNGDISINGTLNGTSSAAQHLTLTPGSGNITLGNFVGNSTRLGTITVTDATNVTMSSAVTAATLVQSAASGVGVTTFNGTVSLTGSITLTGVNFTFNAPVSTATTCTITHSNLLLINAAGDISISGAFSETGAGTVQIAGDITTDGQDITFDNAVTLTGDVHLETGGTSSGSITLSSAVDGAYDFHLQGADITFSSTVETASIRSTAPTITINDNQVVTTGPMFYDGSVVLTNNITFQDTGANGIIFQSFVSGDSVSGNYNLTLNASNSSISVGETIDLSGSSGSAGGTFSATGASGITFDGEVLTIGGNNASGAGGAGGSVTLTSSSGSISLHNIDATGGDGTTAGGSGGNITVQPASGYSGGYPVGKIIINSDLSTSASGNLKSSPGSGGGGAIGGAVTLSANRSGPATVATIISSLAGNNVSVVARNFSMDTYEAMTIFGDITFICANMNLALEDIVALEDLYIFSGAGSSVLLTHGDRSILNNNGVLYTSTSLHFFAGGTYSAIGSFVPAGPVDARSLNLSTSDFRPLLLYNGHILNYDLADIVPPGVISEALRQAVRYDLAIANAQLSDLLPIYQSSVLPPYYFRKSERIEDMVRLCRKKMFCCPEKKKNEVD